MDINMTSMIQEEALINEYISSLSNYKMISYERLRSKRNNVFKVELIREDTTIKAVLKIYEGKQSKENCKKEYENLTIMKKNNIPAPDIIHFAQDWMLLTYIEGKLIVDLVDTLDSGGWVEALAHWLSDFHKLQKSGISYLKSDSNLRNFVYDGKKVYGLDFEQIEYGDPIEDLADICFFMLTNRPALVKAKDTMVRKLIASYERHSRRNMSDIARHILLSREKIREIRKIHKKK